MSYFHKPQALWWRKFLFQVHLWVGLVLALYIFVIGISGSILVFKLELAKLTSPELFRAAHVPLSAQVDLATFIDNARAANPKLSLVTAYAPGIFGDTAFAYMAGGDRQWVYVLGDPATGKVLGSVDITKNWLFWVSMLHVRLLAGEIGLMVNGIGAVFLLLLCISGMVLWWPGIKRWARGLTVDFRRSWKRINFDLHSATGFWLLVFVLLWAVSGIYFAWPKPIEHFVNRFSSVATAVEPPLTVELAGRPPADVRTLLSAVRTAEPGRQITGIFVPQDPKAPVEVFLPRSRPEDFSQMDYLYLHPATGERLAVWHAGINPTLGSKLLYWLGPLHFGVYWGIGIKIIWALAGLSLPALAVTGALMYWNRALGRKWKHLRSRRTAKVQPELVPLVTSDH